MGEALYLQAGHFVNYSLLVDDEIQTTIKKYIYTKLSNTPPYRSVQETQFTFIDDFLVIDQESKHIANSENKGK